MYKSSSQETSTEAGPESKKNNEYQYDLYKDHNYYEVSGTAVALDIPGITAGGPVTVIADSAFASSKTLVRVSVPDTVESLEKECI